MIMTQPANNNTFHSMKRTRVFIKSNLGPPSAALILILLNLLLLLAIFKLISSPHPRLNILDPADWKLIAVSSQETIHADNKAQYAFDNNPTTYWHTDGSDKTATHPHYLVIDLMSPYSINGFFYYPRLDGINGRIFEYEFYAAMTLDALNQAKPLSKGKFTIATSQQIFFPAATARFIKFVAISEVNNMRFASAAEIGVYLAK